MASVHENIQNRISGLYDKLDKLEDARDRGHAVSIGEIVRVRETIKLLRELEDDE